ncbi:MAG: ribonuclease R [Clostridia bacterium]|nr:ribonuclease R [Clostridia bacterium]
MQKCVGLLQQEHKNGVVLLDRPDPNLGREVWISANHLNGAPYGMKVVCELLAEVTEPVTRPAAAKIIEVLGDPGRPDVAMLSIIRQHGLPESFSEPVKQAADSYPLQLDEDTIARELERGRVDRRHEQIMTIDGEDARDLDDAIGIEALESGGFELGVHIADVSHYVEENSTLDQEAQKRATSVYLVDRVIPMLPPRLSNGICSLNPDQDRLTFSAVMTFNASGEMTGGHLEETIIRSRARSSYNEVCQALEEDRLPEDREPWFLEKLRLMRHLADLLKQKRLNRGSIEFEFPETHVDLDQEGHPVDIYPYPITFANGIIEEFMLAANELVAHFANQKKLPFLYRVHELPDPEKLQKFTRLANVLGVPCRLRGAPTPGQLAKVLEKVKTEPFGQTLSQLLLRSLAKARYAPENLGHFGLASEYYCHFTSPIRRYPDLFVHRVLKAQLHGHVKRKTWMKGLDELADHVSDMERTAMYAERDTVDQKAAEYMRGKLGDVFTGIVSGFNAAGIFIQLENTVEGMVPFRTMQGYLRYDDERMRVTNETTGLVYSIGDAVTVQVAQADIIQRRIDFAMVTHLDKELVQADQKNGKGSRFDRDRKSPEKNKKSGSGKKKHRDQQNKSSGHKKADMTGRPDGGKNNRKRKKKKK